MTSVSPANTTPCSYDFGAQSLEFCFLGIQTFLKRRDCGVDGGGLRSVRAEVRPSTNFLKCEDPGSRHCLVSILHVDNHINEHQYSQVRAEQ